MSDDAAVGALLQGMTAHFLVHDTYPVQPEDDVLVHAAAGGVGPAAHPARQPRSGPG